MKEKKKSLYISMLTLSTLPLLVLGIVIAVFTSWRIAATMNSEVEDGFKSLGISILTMYDKLYPGDYIMRDEADADFMKGLHPINEDYEIIDQLKEELGIDITFFYGDTRILTTIRDHSGERITGTKAGEKVVEDVLETGREHFYPNIRISDTSYFAYYTPIINAGAECVGMLFIAKPSAEVRISILLTVMPIVIITIGFMFVIGYCSALYSKQMIGGFTRIDAFLYKVSQGDLTSVMDISLLDRKDEMGEMARHIVTMQNSFKELIEQDLLTKLDNRRCGENKLKEIHKKSILKKYDFAVAIGDIDFFKRVNDTYGHSCGDLVLKSTAALLKTHMEGKGRAVRWGGEEFLLIYEAMNIREAEKELQKLLYAIQEMNVEYEGFGVKITMTFGIVDGSSEKVDNLLKYADNRLYYGKMHGRNCIIADE